MDLGKRTIAPVPNYAVGAARTKRMSQGILDLHKEHTAMQLKAFSESAQIEHRRVGPSLARSLG